MSVHDDEQVPELPDDLRELVGGMRDDALEDERVARVRQRLGPTLSPRGPVGSAAASGTRAKLAAFAVVAVFGLGAFLYARSGAPKPLNTTSTPSETAAPSSTAEAAEAVSAGPEAPPASASALAATPADSSAPVTSVMRPPSSARAQTEQEDILAEEAILHRARAALATSPQEALDLTDAHAKKFPHGALTQEREIVAIDALDRLGRAREAATRAERFRTRFPLSPYVQELKNRGLVE